MRILFALWFMLLASYFVVNKVRADRRVAVGTERIARQMELLVSKGRPTP